MSHTGLPVRVRDLVPGDRVTIGAGPLGLVATFVGQGPHPVYASLRAVTWYFPEGHPMLEGLKFTVDALSPDQEVGEVVNLNRTPEQRIEQLHTSLNKKDNS